MHKNPIKMVWAIWGSIYLGKILWCFFWQKNAAFNSKYLAVLLSLIRGVLIQSCSTGAKNFTKCVFYHVQFSGVTQNIAYHRAIKTKF